MTAQEAKKGRGKIPATLEKLKGVLSQGLLKNPSGTRLLALNRLLPLMIPFNSVHKFKVKKLESEFCLVELPKIRNNLNHINSIHACAMATCGEYSAGLILLKNFLYDFRLIMKSLHCEYHFQAKTHLKSTCRLPRGELKRLKQEVFSQGLSMIELNTQLHDADKNCVATITTTWQVKDWKKVKTQV